MGVEIILGGIVVDETEVIRGFVVAGNGKDEVWIVSAVPWFVGVHSLGCCHEEFVQLMGVKQVKVGVTGVKGILCCQLLHKLSGVMKDIEKRRCFSGLTYHTDFSDY